jgi:hypothetical protein
MYLMKLIDDLKSNMARFSIFLADQANFGRGTSDNGQSSNDVSRVRM